MKRLCMAVAIAGFLACVAAAGAADSPGADAVQLRCQIFRVVGNLAGETSLDEQFWAAKEPPDADLKTAVTLFTGARFRLGSDRLEVDAKGWRWNGTGLEHGQNGISFPESSIQLIAQPTMTLKSGEAAGIDVRSNQKIEYFERVEDDMFRLKRLETPTGLRIETRVEKEEGDRYSLPNLTFSLQSVERREPIPGLSLRVGRPILKNREYTTPLLLQSGKDYGILLNPGGGHGVLIFRLRVEAGTDRPASETGATK